MSSNAAIVCNALSVVDLALIVGSFLYLNNRVQRLEKSKEIIHSSKKEGLEDRLTVLEEEREILLKRLNGYDDLLLQIMNRFKDINPLLESHSSLVSSLAQAIEDRPAAVHHATFPIAPISDRARGRNEDKHSCLRDEWSQSSEPMLRKRKVANLSPSSIISGKKSDENVLSRRSYFDNVDNEPDIGDSGHKWSQLSRSHRDPTDHDSDSETSTKSIVFSDTDENDEKIDGDENDEFSSYLREE